MKNVRRVWTLCTLAAAISLTGATAVRAGDVTVQVSGLRNQVGQIVVALHNSPESFPSRWAKALVVRRTVASAGAAVTFENVPPGRYAIIALHDEDGDGEMTKSFVGLPVEGFGTSNNPRFFGPPRYASAAIDLRESVMIPIRIVYY
jgi:uncharacterized protein (DUF2141 family)